MVALLIGSSFYVAVEPAPTDVFFVILVFFLLARRSVGFPVDLHPVLSAGLLVFVAANVVSMLSSGRLLIGFVYLAITLYLCAFWYIMVCVVSTYGSPMVALIERAYLFAACMAALVALGAYYWPSLHEIAFLPPTLGPRFQGSFKDPNVFSPFIVAAFLIVINDLLTGRIITLLRLILLLIYGIAIVGAFSRGAFANLLAALLVLVALHSVIIRRRVAHMWAMLSLLAVVSLTSMVVWLNLTGLEDFLAERFAMQDYDTKRFSVQSETLDLLAESPFGIGPGQIEYALRYSAHNLYLRVAAENGLIGFLGWMAFLLGTIWVCFQATLRRGSRVHLYCLAVLTGILVNSLVIDSLHWRHFFLYLALPIGLARYERRRARSAVSVALAATRS